MMTRMVCPLCGSVVVHAEAWATLNDEILIEFVESADNFCGNCEEHFRGRCKVNVDNGECVDCANGGDHTAEWTVNVARLTVASVEADLIRSAQQLLVEARNLLAKAGSPKSLARVRLALTSVRGALSNARHRVYRPERKRIKRAPKVNHGR